MAKRGPKTKYDPDKHPDEGYKLTLLGMTDIELAQYWDIDESTLTRWKQQYKELRTSLKEGKEIADAKVTMSLYKRACGYKVEEVIKETGYRGDNSVNVIRTTEKEIAPDPISMIFWLKNRQPKNWRDKPQEENNSNVNELNNLIDAIKGSKKTEE